MALKIYNTLTRKKEEFKPIKKGEAGIYTCGPTVYWFQHIGNLRSYIFSDILSRVLLYNQYNVKKVINVTDVGHLTSDADEGEDKMEKAALKEGKSAKEISHFYFDAFHNDLKKLNILEPQVWSWATEHIKEQIELIKKLEAKGFTYKTSDGIYFDTSKFSKYGDFARLDVKGLQAGQRIEMGEKRNKTDFALWKFSGEPGKRQQEWDSPWGLGFPGWHIECSAMSMKYLGETIDIHTGGIDHIPVHHTNEIAQSEAATGKKFVNYWMHGAFLTFKGEKISKSKGGLYTVSELEKMGHNPLAFRYLCLQTHYRKPMEFSIDSLEAAKEAVKKINDFVSSAKGKEDHPEMLELVVKEEEKFKEAINNDLNMPEALAVLFDFIKEANKLGAGEKAAGFVKKMDRIFGILQEQEGAPEEIKKLAEERRIAKENKDWKSSDKLREKIKKLGWEVRDEKDGTYFLNKIN